MTVVVPDLVDLAEEREREAACDRRRCEAAKALAARREERAAVERYKAKLGSGLLGRHFDGCETWRDIVEEWDDIMWV